jgi:DNA adenine methylase
VENTFKGLYFEDDENRLIDILEPTSKIKPVQKAIAMSALMRACFKNVAWNFTYVGHRYDDGRKDLTMSFRAQFLEAVDAINAAVFDRQAEQVQKRRCHDLDLH